MLSLCIKGLENVVFFLNHCIVANYYERLTSTLCFVCFLHVSTLMLVQIMLLKLSVSSFVIIVKHSFIILVFIDHCLSSCAFTVFFFFYCYIYQMNTLLNTHFCRNIDLHIVLANEANVLSFFLSSFIIFMLCIAFGADYNACFCLILVLLSYILCYDLYCTYRFWFAFRLVTLLCINDYITFY